MFFKLTPHTSCLSIQGLTHGWHFVDDKGRDHYPIFSVMQRPTLWFSGREAHHAPPSLQIQLSLTHPPVPCLK